MAPLAAQLAASAVSPPQKKRDADEDAKRDRSKRLGKGADGRGVFKATPPQQPRAEGATAAAGGAGKLAAKKEA